MSDKSEIEQPDVEGIIAEIQGEIDRAPEPIPEPVARDILRRGNLHDNLGAMNAACLLGKTDPGVTGLYQKVVLRLLAFLIEDLNTFHTSTVQSLNKMSRMLDGCDTAEVSDLVEKTKGRIDLLTGLSRRLAAYDDLDIDGRLRRLEELIPEEDGQGAR